MIVPDRIQSRFAVNRLGALGGALGARVGTFSDYYHAALRKSQDVPALLTEIDVYRMLRGIIEEALEAKQLTQSAAIAKKSGFVRMLRGHIAELLEAKISPEMYRAALEDGSRALLVEMATLYAAYQEAKRVHRRVDEQDLGWLAYAKLRERAGEPGPACVVVDGFDSFTGLQLAILKEWDDCAGELLITLPGDDAMQRPIFRRFRPARDNLFKKMPDAQVHILAAADDHTLASAFNGHLFEPEPIRQGPVGVTLLEVRSPYHEAREALRWLKARILRDGVSPGDCALVVPDLHRYQDDVASAAREFGIPIRQETPRPLISSPVVATVLSLLSLPLGYWPRRELLDILSSPFLDVSGDGIRPEDIPALELVSLYGQILEGLQDWHENLHILAQMDEPPRNDLEGMRLPAGEDARRLEQALSSIAARFSSLSGRKTAAEWVTWFEGVLDSLRFVDCLHTPDELAAWHGVRQALAEMTHDLPGIESSYDYERFVEELQRALAAVHWRRSYSHQAVSVLQPSQARGGRYEALAVLGLSEGLLPAVEREDPFLPDDLRDRIGLESRLGQEQRGLFFQVATRADRYLLCMRPYLSDVGAPWEASPYWQACKPFAAYGVERVAAEAPRPLCEAASQHEVLLWSARKGTLWEPAEETMSQRWDLLRHAQNILEQRSSTDERTPYDGHVPGLRDVLMRRYCTGHVWSASRLERYGTCPFMFFVQDVLGLETFVPPEPGYDALQLGSLLHELLERSFRETAEPEHADEVVATLHRVAGEVFDRAPARYGFKPTALWEIEQNQWLAVLEETIRALQKKQDGWVPVAFEQSFGVHGQPLEVTLRPENVLLRGVVDRIDRHPDGRLCIIDYKTGSSGLDTRALDEGRKIQLPIYAMAARGMGYSGDVTEGFYWIVPSAKSGSLKLSRFKSRRPDLEEEGIEGAFNVTLMHLEAMVGGIQNGAFSPVPPADGCPSYCPAAGWCWHYTPGRGA